VAQSVRNVRQMNLSLNERVDYLLSKPYPTRKDLQKHCEFARSEGYRAIVVPSSLIHGGYELLDGTNLKVAAIIGFPFGSSDPDVKRYETEVAADFNAHEIELVPNLGWLAEGRFKEVLRNIRDVVEAADERPVTVVVESHLWDESQLENIAKMVLDSGATSLSTSIALQGRHASAEALQHIRELLEPDFGLKVGGLRSLDGAETLVSAGASKLGLAG
jgi:deoxyribose-phosphate aldolase